MNDKDRLREFANQVHLKSPFDLGLPKTLMTETVSMSEPEFSYARLTVKGREAIRAVGWALSLLVVAQAIALLVGATAVLVYVLR